MQPRWTALYRSSLRSDESPQMMADLEAWLRTHPTPHEWYTDDEREGQAWWTGYLACLEDLHQQRLARLVVWRLDVLRLGTGGLAELMGELAQAGAELVSLQDQLTLPADLLRALPEVLNATVNCERRLMGARIAAGCSKAKTEGKRWGGSKPRRRLKVTEELEAQVRALAAEGSSRSAIAEATGLSRPTVYRLVGTARTRGARAQKRATLNCEANHDS